MNQNVCRWLVYFIMGQMLCKYGALLGVISPMTLVLKIYLVLKLKWCLNIYYVFFHQRVMVDLK